MVNSENNSLVCFKIENPWVENKYSSSVLTIEPIMALIEIQKSVFALYKKHNDKWYSTETQQSFETLKLKSESIVIFCRVQNNMKNVQSKSIDVTMEDSPSALGKLLKEKYYLKAEVKKQIQNYGNLDSLLQSELLQKATRLAIIKAEIANLTRIV